MLFIILFKGLPEMTLTN